MSPVSETRARLVDHILVPVLAVGAGLAVASIFIIMAGANPISAYGAMFRAGFGCDSLSRCQLFTTFQLATPLILTGLSAVVAFRSGLFSIGQEGQLLLGGMAAAWIGFAVGLPPVIHALVAIAGGMLVGAAYAWAPGVLKVRLGVNEIISTIVLNTIAFLLVTYLINFPLRADQTTTAASPVIDGTARLAPFVAGTKWGPGFVVAVAAAVMLTVYLFRTRAGYEKRMTGEAPAFAWYGGIPHRRTAIRGMMLSGSLSGLAGAIQVLGVHYRMLDGFSSGLGFDGLTAAILGQVHPVGTAVTALFFAGLRQGAEVGLQFSAGVPRELGGVIIALMILFVATDRLFRSKIGLLGRGRRSLPTDLTPGVSDASR